jgi:hypothetical protein
MQAPFRILATKKLKQISASSTQHNTSTKWQSYNQFDRFHPVVHRHHK